MPSAIEHPIAIDKCLATEIARGHVTGPFGTPLIPNFHCSPFGVTPKKGQPGKWRLILDLSSPDQHSVNDGISKDHSRFNIGPGALMAKFDVESAYRNVTMHPDERYLFGMRWREFFFIDLELPFGLRSAPFIFNSIADMVEWMLKVNYSIRYLLHYFDDFLSLGPAGSSDCADSITIPPICVFSSGTAKCEGPTSVLIFPGIELHSIAQTARSPHAKLVSTLQLLYQWASKKWCTRKELESIIGSLHHVTNVVPPGHTFLRRMIDLLCAFRSSSHLVRPNRELRRDLAWWLEFLQSWNGISFFRIPSGFSLPDLFVSSDSSGANGFGAI